ncbi:MAG: oligopeptide ABC transporter ATP-binding protein OppF [SAR324 cluster bacterium]|uniref:Oligopeptide ABC transporter ATP-binding protein OppF n=1 Tax=SAR324 cluster bacterium TaxID=2024889 RepID=A0A2A4SKQ0_9DELT|nr:MAG: oligopeptide ABC transporter ATP-binding protein OppF [SAR324 cluster bacterium]
MEKPILEIKNLKKHYAIAKGLFQKPDVLKANNDLSFEVFKGETFAIVGESGCGKSTIAKMLLKIEGITGGQILFEGKDITKLSKSEMVQYRKDVQIIFQDPYSSLNPRWKVGKIIGEPLRLNTDLSKQEIEKKVRTLMDKVGLLEEHFDRFPHQFSGGQRQRIGIARALALSPKVIVCDEPVSALDVSIQSQVLNLLMDLQKEFQFTYIFISHDLGVVEHISDRIMVMYLGKCVEIATVEQLMGNPLHPYTKALLSAIPDIDPDKRKEKVLLQGELVTPINPPPGCLFRTRCPHAQEDCKKISMDLEEANNGHYSACPFFLKD